jgi:CHAD domain-containing protein
MAFQLTANESISSGVKRNVAKEIDKALEQLRTPDNERDAVHEARKRLKKVRAALRLVREHLGDEVYRRENYGFRDAARPLTEVRDAEVLIEALDKLAEHFAAAVEPKALAEVRETLLANQRTVDRRVLKDNHAFQRVTKQLEAARARLDDYWKIDADGWPAIASGLKRVYRAGYRLRSAAAAKPTVENLHEWRKQAKYLWHQLQLLEPAWISVENELGGRFHELSTTLGEDHDLAVLRQMISTGGPQPLVPLIDRRRAELQRAAFALGGQLYAEAPRDFADRIERYWTAWKRSLARPQPPTRAPRAPVAKPARRRARPPRSPQSP